MSRTCAATCRTHCPPYNTSRHHRRARVHRGGRPGHGHEPFCPPWAQEGGHGLHAIARFVRKEPCSLAPDCTPPKIRTQPIFAAESVSMSGSAPGVDTGSSVDRCRVRAYVGFSSKDGRNGAWRAGGYPPGWQGAALRETPTAPHGGRRPQPPAPAPAVCAACSTCHRAPVASAAVRGCRRPGARRLPAPGTRPPRRIRR